MTPYQLAPSAERDLAEIAHYYAVEKENPRAARRVVEAIRATCRRAGEDPQLGRSRDELGRGVRSKLVLQYPYLLYFRPAPRLSGAHVQIIRILHQARDVDTAFAEGEEAR